MIFVVDKLLTLFDCVSRILANFLRLFLGFEQNIRNYFSDSNKYMYLLIYIDKADDNAVRHVRICPLYAISRLFFDV